MKREVAGHARVLLLGAVLGVFSLVTTASEDSATPPTFGVPGDLAIGAVACLVLLLRVRRPVITAVLLIVLGVLSSTAFGVTFVGLFAVALRCSWRAVAPVAVLHVMPVVSLYLAELTTRQYVESVVFVTLVDATIITSGRWLRSVRERAVQAEERQRLRVEEARRHERERIAREMHDVLAHRISLLAVHAGALEFHPDAPPGQVASTVAVIRSSAHEALEELRAVIGVLRDDGTDPDRPQPTLADLPELVDESRRSGATVELTGGVDLGAVPAAIGRHAYRIVQEGLTNARKHAPGALVRVALAGEGGGRLTVELRNRLSAPTPVVALPGAGAGLIGLRERAELVGGNLEHGRTLDGDFRLWASLPWPT